MEHKPFHSQRAHLAVLDDFVAGRTSAAAFIARFEDLWRRDAVGAFDVDDGSPVAGRDVGGAAGLHGILGSVESLCASYAQSLPDGCGYRVSEEQFRKEIESLTSGLRLAGVRRA